MFRDFTDYNNNILEKLDTTRYPSPSSGFKNLEGQTFERIHVDKIAGIDNKHQVWYWCTCSCGSIKIIRGRSLVTGVTKSCGCYSADRIADVGHSLKGKYRRLYNGERLHELKIADTYYDMYDRCYNPKNCKYHIYGERGIKICDEWLEKPDGIINFINWAYANGYNEELTLDREDPDKDYSPDNCHWVTLRYQNNNLRSNIFIYYKEYVFTVGVWADILNTKFGILRKRIELGWSPEKILTHPVKNIHDGIIEYERLIFNPYIAYDLKDLNKYNKWVKKGIIIPGITPYGIYKYIDGEWRDIYVENNKTKISK